MSSKGNFMGGMALGLMVGAAAGTGLSLLYAPRRGKRTRYLIKEKFNNIWGLDLDRLDDNQEDVDEIADKTQQFVHEVIDSAAAKRFSENNFGG